MFSRPIEFVLHSVIILPRVGELVNAPIIITMVSYVEKTVKEFKDAVVTELKKIPLSYYKRPINIFIPGSARVMNILDSPESVIPNGEYLQITVKDIVSEGYALLVFYTYSGLVSEVVVNRKMSGWKII